MSSKYIITIEEIHKLNVKVTANSIEEAITIAETKYEQGETKSDDLEFVEWNVIGTQIKSK